MTPEQMDVIFAALFAPPPGRSRRPDLVLVSFGTEDGVGLGLRLLREALESGDSDEVEAALIVAFNFGVDERFADPLMELALSDWHRRHEDVVSMLGMVGDTRAVPVLARMTEWVPAYLDFDDARALGTNAVHVLAKMPGGRARRIGGRSRWPGQPCV